jgi:isopenicillin N synthase-like dioxygenase
METHDAEVVTLQYEALVRGDDLNKEIERAFGMEGLGLLTVAGIPGLAPLRERLLPLARTFARLPRGVQEQYEHEPSFYSVGWSHGKEKLGGGQPDFAKGSYYNNPLHNRPVDDEDLIKRYPSFACPNIWPTAHVPEMEGGFMELGQLMQCVGLLVAKQCDAFVGARCPTYEPAKLHGLLSASRVCKGRLLHYYALPSPSSSEPATIVAPQPAGEPDPFSSWCGWHNDHGSLTSLVAPLYLDEATGERARVTDPSAGLYVRGRRGQLVRARIPEDHLAFQIGETAQIHSGGLLQATPHAVRGASVPGVSRETFAIFMEPEWDYPMLVPEGMDPAETQSKHAKGQLPRGVPPLHDRWGTAKCPFTTCNFGQFTESTFSLFY